MTWTIQHLSFNLHLTQNLTTSPVIHHNVKMVKDLHKQYRQLEALDYTPALPPNTAAVAALDPVPFLPYRLGGPINVFSSTSTSFQPPSVPDPSQDPKTWDDTDWDTPLVPPTRAYVRQPYYKKTKKSRSKSTHIGNSEEELTLATFGLPGPPVPPFEVFVDNDTYGAQLRRMPPPPMYLEGAPTRMPRFGEFPREVQIMIFRFAAADRMRLIENKTNPAETRHYRIHGGGRLLSDYIETKVYVRWIFARRLHFGCHFDDHFKVSRLARISALEYWRDRIRDHVTSEWAIVMTEEEKEDLERGSRRVKEGMVRALDELAGMLKEDEEDDVEEGGVRLDL